MADKNYAERDDDLVVKVLGDIIINGFSNSARDILAKALNDAYEAGAASVPTPETTKKK